MSTDPFSSISKPGPTECIIPGSEVADVSRILSSTEPDQWDSEDVRKFLIKTLPVGGISGRGDKNKEGARLYEEVMVKMDIYTAKFPIVAHLLDPYYLVIYPMSPTVRQAMANYPNSLVTHNRQDHIFQFPGNFFSCRDNSWPF